MGKEKRSRWDSDDSDDDSHLTKKRDTSKRKSSEEKAESNIRSVPLPEEDKPKPKAEIFPGATEDEDGAVDDGEKEVPNYEPSGKLATSSNTVSGTLVKWAPPPELRTPSDKYRLYVFKGDEEAKEPYMLHKQSAYIFGRDRAVVDIPIDHPSCSKQHAVLCFRQRSKEDILGNITTYIRPYLLDLGSTNGTLINGEKLDSKRYYELKDKDTIQFGNSSREYVFIHVTT